MSIQVFTTLLCCDRWTWSVLTTGSRTKMTPSVNQGKHKCTDLPGPAETQQMSVYF